MQITALCPTYRHPQLLANSLALWNLQDYPADKRTLLILDDDPTFSDQDGENWRVYAYSERFESISAKYNFLLARIPHDTNAILVWEDDDIYLPGYISSHVTALEGAEFSKADVVLSDYTREIRREPARGRFHSSMAIRRTLIERIDGWPRTHRADFDQQLMSQLYSTASTVAKPWPDNCPDAEIPFIYRWHSGAAHCQSVMNLGQTDETWWSRCPTAYKPVEFVGQLVPQLDSFSASALARGSQVAEASA